MKFEMSSKGSKNLLRGLSALPVHARAELKKAITASIAEGVETARLLAPVDTGELREGIKGHVTVDGSGNIHGEVTSWDAKAWVSEFGRKRGDKGKTDPRPAIQNTQALLQKKHPARLRGAINRSVKKAFPK